MATATQHIATPHRYGEGWLIPSRSRPGVAYYINADVTRCTCKGFAYRRHCAHLAVALAAQHLIGEMLGEDDA
jgi:hypothetical protein